MGHVMGMREGYLWPYHGNERGVSVGNIMGMIGSFVKKVVQNHLFRK